MTHQPGIFVEGTSSHWFQEYRVREPDRVTEPLRSIRVRSGSDLDPEGSDPSVQLVVGFGPTLSRQLLGNDVPLGLTEMEPVEGPRHSAPATNADLFLWLHSDRHDLNFEVAAMAAAALADTADLIEDIPAFVYRDSRDLTGFIDGTENPSAEEGRDLTVVTDGPGKGGVLGFTQRWVHDLDAFSQLPVGQQEAAVGRTKPDSTELDPLPDDSHVGRVVIHDSEGAELEIYRRSVPYGTPSESGLFFLGFTPDLEIIDAMLGRMFGADGPSDRLIEFSTPVSGSFWYMPPEAALDALGADG